MTENYGMDLNVVEDEGEIDSSSFDLNVTNPEKRNPNTTGRPITKSMFIGEIIESHPEVVPAIMDYGLHCIGCGASAFETLEEGFMGHGVSDDEIDRIVKDLNLVIERHSKRQN